MKQPWVKVVSQSRMSGFTLLAQISLVYLTHQQASSHHTALNCGFLKSEAFWYLNLRPGRGGVH